MYCTLQEAYQIPTFATRRKRACGPNNEDTASAFDPHGADEGSAQLAPAYRKYNREDFVDANTSTNPSAQMQQAFGNSSTVRNITGSPMIDSVAYTAGQASDYKYYEKFGLKYPEIKKEGFADRPETCPSKDTIYRIPISDEAKKQYSAAMAVAIDPPNQPISTSQVLNQPRKAEMQSVSGYYDEDLEQYLKVSDMKATPMPESSIPKEESKAVPYDPESSPFANALASFKGSLRPDSSIQENMALQPNSMQSWLPQKAQAYIMDLLLFILCGLLVIFLCDQLYRLAAMTGLRDTIEFMRPYINVNVQKTS